MRPHFWRIVVVRRSARPNGPDPGFRHGDRAAGGINAGHVRDHVSQVQVTLGRLREIYGPVGIGRAGTVHVVVDVHFIGFVGLIAEHGLRLDAPHPCRDTEHRDVCGSRIVVRQIVEMKLGSVGTILPVGIGGFLPVGLVRSLNRDDGGDGEIGGIYRGVIKFVTSGRL